MGKGSGGTRSGLSSADRDVLGYIQAITAKGGQDYQFFAKYDTPENREKFSSWLDAQSKVDGENLYRGSYLLSGDITKYLVLGEWEEGKTIISGDMISGNSNGLLHFSKDSQRVFGYEGMKPKPKAEYDRFENEPMRVKFNIETQGVSFVDISSSSHYQEEKEAVAKSSSKFIFMGAVYHSSPSYWEIKLREKK